MQPTLLFLAVLAATPAEKATRAKLPDTSKMNILLIDIEDCNADVLSCYGNPICKTPNLDRLSRGTLHPTISASRFRENRQFAHR